MNKVVRDITLTFYIAFVLILAVVALGMSYISDGPVPLSVHIVMPLMVIAIFITPLLVWRRLNKKQIASPPQIKQHKYQDKVIVVFLILWGVYIAISYFVGQGN